MNMKTEETTYWTREYISDELLRTVKVGETWSLDYTVRSFKYDPADHLVALDGFGLDGCWRWKYDPADHLVAFDGFGFDGCWRWKHEATGRVFVYTKEQCLRLIYKLIPR
jgi:hypothetical protein